MFFNINITGSELHMILAELSTERSSAARRLSGEHVLAVGVVDLALLQ